MSRPFQPLPGDVTADPGLLDRIQAAIADAFDALKRTVTNDKIVSVTLDNTRDWPVTHGLGHAPASWEVVDLDGNATVWRSTAVNARPRDVILLRASAPVNVRVRFS